LPENISNSHKIRTIAGKVENLIPENIGPLSATAEKEIIGSLMSEITDTFAIKVDKNPVLDRCSGDVVFGGDDCVNSRVFAVGGSHIARLVGSLAEAGLSVINLAKPGWTLSEVTAQEIKSKLKKYNAGTNDFILLDPLSNNAFCGTDTDGNFCDPVKVGDTWHIPGELNVRTKSYLKVVLSHFKVVTNSFPETKILTVLPIPRYVTGKCCDNENHVSNFADPGFLADISDGLEKAEELLTGWLQSLPVVGMIIDFRAGTDEPGADLPYLTTSGDSVWQASDPVHPSASLYSSLAEEIRAALAEYDVSEAGQGGCSKRPRLESMVVRKAGKSNDAPARPQSWSLGILPDQQRLSRGGQQGGNRGGRGHTGRGRGRLRGWRGFSGRGPKFWAPRKY
jgi:hypothetical protein